MPVYKSITLSPGESYILPAGATVLSVSNSAIYLSENGCAPLDNVEPLRCYAILIGGTDQVGNETHTWSQKASKIISIEISGISYTLNIPMDANGSFYMGDLKTFIENTPAISGLFFNMVNGSNYGNGGRGGEGHLVFKTVPSVAESIVVTTSNAFEGAPGQSTFTHKILAQPVENYANVKLDNPESTGLAQFCTSI